MVVIIIDDLEVEVEVIEDLYGYLLILGTLHEHVQRHDEHEVIEAMLMQLYDDEVVQDDEVEDDEVIEGYY